MLLFLLFFIYYKLSLIELVRSKIYLLWDFLIILCLYNILNYGLNFNANKLNFKDVNVDSAGFRR